MAKPTIVLVHGSWHSPDHFHLLTAELTNLGYKSVAVALPSTQSPDLPPASLEDDTNAINSAVISELDDGNNVVVVGHSYGGTPTNNSCKGLDKKSRTAAGASTYVGAVVFLCAAPLPEGASFFGTALGGQTFPIHDLNKNKGFVSVGEPGPAYYFFNDLSPEVATKYSDMLRPQSWLAYEATTTYSAALDYPTWYLYCSKDQAMLPFLQEGVVQRMEATGAKIRTETIESSHSPFLSMPEETAKFIVKAAEESLKA